MFLFFIGILFHALDIERSLGSLSLLQRKLIFWLATVCGIQSVVEIRTAQTSLSLFLLIRRSFFVFIFFGFMARALSLLQVVGYVSAAAAHIGEEDPIKQDFSRRVVLRKLRDGYIAILIFGFHPLCWLLIGLVWFQLWILVVVIFGAIVCLLWIFAHSTYVDS